MSNGPRHRAGFAALAIGLSVGALQSAHSEAVLHRIGDTDIAAQVLGTSGPVIVFESGLAEQMQRWMKVATPLAGCARVVLYDRPGVGKSGPRRAATVMADTVASDLAELLRKLGLAPPYLLVAHSLGGLYAQAFARARPAEVSAMVLIDAVSPLEPLPNDFRPNFRPPPGTIDAAEFAGLEPSIKALRAGPPFPAVPLIVLAATDPTDAPAREARWQEVQVKTAALSPKGRYAVIPNSGHYIQLDQPAAVITAIVEVAAQAGDDLTSCRP